MATVQGVYLALFGRPADAGGLAYWNGVTKAGADLSVMLKALPALPEYTSRFTNMSNEQIVKSIYQALFGRDPEAKGLADFTAALNNKTQTISSIAVNILDGAQGTDKARIDAKLAASDIFTAHLDLPAEQTAYNASTIQVAKDYLAGVTETTPGTAASADAAILKMQQQGAPNPGDDPGPNGAPVFTSGGVAVIDEHKAVGTFIYDANATDDSSTVTFSIVPGANSNLFAINAQTGVVTVAGDQNFETLGGVVNFSVRAQDSTGFASTKAVVLTLNDVPEVATAGADTISWAKSSVGYSVDGLGGIDTITGGSGNDTIRGGAAGDSIDLGQGGKDTVVFNSTFSLNGNDNINGFTAGAGAGADVIKIDGTTAFAGASQYTTNNGILLAGKIGVITAANATTLDTALEISQEIAPNNQTFNLAANSTGYLLSGGADSTVVRVWAIVNDGNANVNQNEVTLIGTINIAAGQNIGDMTPASIYAF